jgi:hypothetical protein
MRYNERRPFINIPEKEDELILPILFSIIMKKFGMIKRRNLIKNLLLFLLHVNRFQVDVLHFLFVELLELFLQLINVLFQFLEPNKYIASSA